ncbi:uncharacterized protein PAC_01675 [Phialocephala subalpina]|uniref:Uncharacterized protein n=1 Tax=Phialocephala subalpina TaxID=576137 RepID=A0A1L7WGB0_9HELO|nr:uncharacterized protein PAC_01675 [Phialocephala subalpina]
MAALAIGGNARNRLIQASVLLHMLEPVRGEPTAYGLDQDPHEIESPRDRLLKRKFLDSFALVCATKREGDSVSAACMEEGRPEGTVVRIASNCGVSDTTLLQLREIVDEMSCLAVRDPLTGEDEILLRIIRLDSTKIRSYLKDLCIANNVFEEPVEGVESRITKASICAAPSTTQQFLEWFRHIFVVRDSCFNAEPEVLAEHIRWAQKAKRFYLHFLKAAFAPGDHPLPRWILTVFKLGRYGIASKAFVELATKLPSLVNPMIVEPVLAPPKTPFAVPEEETPLTCVLKRTVGEKRTEELIPRLAAIWNTTDAEAHFRKACSLNLVAHAEMQLVNFYDHSQQCRPILRFIGVSKKSCYLCHLFLTNYSDSFSVSSCHQKLYPTWMPPPAVNSKIYKRYKVITRDLSKTMEATAKQHLDSRLGTKRRLIPPDSTAGVSLSGLTESSTKRKRTQSPAGLLVGLAASEDSVVNLEPQASFHPTELVSLGPMSLEIDQATTSTPVQTALSESTDLSSEHAYLDSISKVVFHFTRLGDASKQDIICISDTLDHSTKCPSWTKLIELLKVDDGFGIGFKEGREFLMVGNRIRVRNERQFLACLQYMRNVNVLNQEVVVCAVNEAAHSTLPKPEVPLIPEH